MSNRGPLARAGGLVEVIDPLARAARADWIAQAELGALDGVELDPACARGFYAGACNGALWPLLHDVGVPARYADEDWRDYVEANRRFAERAIDRVRGDDRVVFFIQDYHLLLVPTLLRRRLPRAAIVHFIHVPWPAPPVFSACPWADAIVDGLSGCDLLGFHAETYAGHARASLASAGVHVEVFPAGLDAELVAAEAASPEVAHELERLRAELGADHRRVVVSVDRADYTKGIAERLRAIDQLFEQRADLRRSVVFVQVVSPSRGEVGERVAAEAKQLAANVNARFATPEWTPVQLRTEYEPRARIVALYRLAHVCVVSSLRDGMNLVAKEYVASRSADDGCLVLSKHTGAAEQLDGALLVDPADPARFADALAEAIDMTPADARARMHGLRECVRAENVYWWGGRIFSRLVDIAG